MQGVSSAERVRDFDVEHNPVRKKGQEGNTP